MCDSVNATCSTALPASGSEARALCLPLQWQGLSGTFAGGVVSDPVPLDLKGFDDRVASPSGSCVASRSAGRMAGKPPWKGKWEENGFCAGWEAAPEAHSLALYHCQHVP